MYLTITDRSKNMPLCGFGHRSIILLILSIGFLLSAMPLEAQADVGAYSFDWAAADPGTYPSLKPSSLLCSVTDGFAENPLPNATAYTSLESLAPKYLGLGQIVPFEMIITVDPKKTIQPENGRINFTTTFSTVTTSGSDFGYDPAYGVYCAFVDSADPVNIDTVAQAKVEGFSFQLVGNEITGTFDVSGLNNGDRVAVEIWVVLKDTIPPTVTGNVHSGAVSYTAGTSTSTIGGQTDPLLKIGDFFSKTADVSVTKSDIPDPVLKGNDLTYEIVVRNNSPDTVADGVVVTDTLYPNTMLISTDFPNFNYTTDYNTLTNTVTFNIGFLNPGESKNITVVVTTDSAPTGNDTTMDMEIGGTTLTTPYDIFNKVVVTTLSSDPDQSNNIYYQPTNVLEFPYYTYYLDISCETLVLNVISSSPHGTSLTAEWYFEDDSVQLDDGFTKNETGVYISTYNAIPAPVENGNWHVNITEYYGDVLIGENRYNFTVNQDCTGPEFPVGPVVFMLIAGVMYLTMRRKMDGS